MLLLCFPTGLGFYLDIAHSVLFSYFEDVDEHESNISENTLAVNDY